ncbi:MAG TPA: transposase, partial [Cellvibrionaceae bacterium]|nr:transposase [Cellvibrionaceae bacterium]
QRRFWEHTIKNDADYRHHIHYTYYNPVKHGLVTQVKHWPYSSFHRDVRLGLFDINWCGKPIDVVGVD